MNDPQGVLRASVGRVERNETSLPNAIAQQINARSEAYAKALHEEARLLLLAAARDVGCSPSETSTDSWNLVVSYVGSEWGRNGLQRTIDAALAYSKEQVEAIMVEGTLEKAP